MTTSAIWQLVALSNTPGWKRQWDVCIATGRTWCGKWRSHHTRAPLQTRKAPPAPFLRLTSRDCCSGMGNLVGKGNKGPIPEGTLGEGSLSYGVPLPSPPHPLLTVRLPFSQGLCPFAHPVLPQLPLLRHAPSPPSSEIIYGKPKRASACDPCP